jgi:hemolysin III
VPPERYLIPLLGLDEPVSAATHLLGFFLMCAGAICLWRASAGSTLKRRLVVVYLLGAGGLFAASGSYHLCGFGHPWRVTLWHLDHGMIWIGLAATFTPLIVNLCPVGWRRPYLIALWLMAGLGLILELQQLSELPLWVSPLLYVGMGWAGFPSLVLIYRGYGTRYALPLLAGGLLASLGGLIDSYQWPVLVPQVFEAHELLHVLVLMGHVPFWVVIYHSTRGMVRHAERDLVAQPEQPGLEAVGQESEGYAPASWQASPAADVQGGA